MGKHQQEGHQPGATWRLCRRGQLQTGQCPGADGAGFARPGRHKVWGQTEQAERNRARMESRAGCEGRNRGDRRLYEAPGDPPRCSCPPAPSFPSLTHMGRREGASIPAKETANPTVWLCGLPGMKFILTQWPQRSRCRQPRARSPCSLQSALCSQDSTEGLVPICRSHEALSKQGGALVPSPGLTRQFPTGSTVHSV